MAVCSIKFDTGWTESLGDMIGADSGQFIGKVFFTGLGLAVINTIPLY